MRIDSGPMAIFVHGAGGGGWEWTIWRRVFAAHGWSVVAPDLTPAAAGLAATRIEDYAAQVRSWCSDCASPFVLVGASLGGLLALMATENAEPAALVLINPPPPTGIEPRPLRTDYPDIVPWGRDRSLAGTRRTLPDADDATCLFAFRRWRDESGAVLRAAAAGVAIRPPRCPAVVIASGHDVDVPPATSRALADWIGADFRLLASTSHVGPLLGRRAAEVAEETLRWCSSRLSKPEASMYAWAGP